MKLRERIDDVVRPVAPAARLSAVRLLVGTFALVYLVARAPAFVAPGGAHAPFRPVGPVHLLSAAAPGWVAPVVFAIAVPTAIAFLVGFRFRWLGPLFAVALLWLTSYRNSFGMIFHTENMLVVHVLLLSVTDSAAAYSLDARRARAAGLPAPEPARRYGFGLFLLAFVATLTYFLAGVAKLRVSGADWITGDILRNHIAHDNARKALLGDSHSLFGGWIVRHPWVFPPLAALSIVLELGAPLAVLSRRLGRLWSVAIWLFHVGVLAMMWILFPYPLSFIAYAPFFDAEKLVEWLCARYPRRV